MIVTVMKDHPGEGIFPTYEKGTLVENMKPCIQYEFWSSCTLQQKQTYLPNTYVSDGKLNREYNPSELVVKKGDSVEIIEIAFDWALVNDQSNHIGWLPFQILSS